MNSTNIHASCVILAEAGKPFGLSHSGVLLLGASGSGKSDLALRLIDRGCKLVADDRTNLFVRDDKLIASAPEKLAGLIEVRGVGIVEMPFARESEIALVVELVAVEDIPRLPEAERYTPPAPLGLPEAAKPPRIRLTSFEASAPAKILWAVRAFREALFRDERNPK